MVNFREEDKLNFNIVMPLASRDGYGYSGECLVESAHEHNANVGVVAHDWQDRHEIAKTVIDAEIGRYDVADKELLVVYFLPYALNVFRSDVNFCQTMFETTEVPDVWAEIINYRAQGLLVPSIFCKNVFEKKVSVPVEAFPLGVNTQTYYMVEREPSSVFTFLMTGLLHYRKGAEFAVRAFKEEFKPHEKVRLILKTRRGFLDVGDEDIDDGRISVVDADYSRSDMLDLYHAGDCFLAPSRGEASGLTPREAMATGLSVIATNWGGLSEITDGRYTYPLDVEDLEDAPEACSSYEYGITQGQSIGQFARPSITHLRSLMREAFEDQEGNKKKGFDAAMWVQQQWNYSRCGKLWLDAIERLYDRRQASIRNVDATN